MVTWQALKNVHYGNTGNGVSSPGIQNQKDFCLRINIPKGNQSNSRNSKISFGRVDFSAKIFLILYPSFKNSTTRIAIRHSVPFFSHAFVSLFLVCFVNVVLHLQKISHYISTQSLDFFSPSLSCCFVFPVLILHSCCNFYVSLFTTFCYSFIFTLL